MANWKDAGSGVQLWLPTAESDLNATRLSLARPRVKGRGDDFKDEDSILPSIKETNLRTKQEIWRSLFPSPSPELRVLIKENLLPSSSVPTHTPSATLERTFVRRIEAVTTSISPINSTPISDDPPETISNTSTSNCDSYDSDRTDFPASPCPVEDRGYSRRQTRLTSYHFDSSRARKKRHSVRRKLDFGTTSTVKVSSASQKPTRMVCAPEYTQRHRWNEKERELLLVLWRWYARCPATSAKIFNAVFQLQLSASQVTSQFDDIRLYGGNAFPVYKAVFRLIPFHDPKNVYGAMRSEIEATALSLDIDLQKLDEETTSPSGGAQRTRAPKVRKRYKSLVRRASQNDKAKAVQVPVVEKACPLLRTLGGIALRTDAESDMSELMSDVEELCNPTVQPLESSSPLSDNEAQLGFRVWDGRSKGQFSEEFGFVSEAFTIWRGTLPPFSPASAEGRQAIALLSSLHLSMDSGGASTWISVSTSLLQALVKACGMTRPNIAIIDLQNPSLKEPNKTLKASEVLLTLKADNQAWWTRYKGQAESLIWASIPKSAIIHTFSLAHLISLSDTHPAAANFLHLEEFRPNRTTKSVSSSLRAKTISLDAPLARAMGLVCVCFGLNGDNVQLHHISGLVGCLVDSWSVTTDDGANSIEKAVAVAFAGALDSRVHCARDVGRAFVEGVRQGTARLEFFAKRRRGGVRRRKG